jgi:hypothetical protein
MTHPIPAYAFNEDGEQAYDYDTGEDETETVAPEPNQYVIAVYELDRHYGGAEEGGWWYNSGSLVRLVKLTKNKAKAYEYVRRFNHWIDLLCKPKYGLSSVCYEGGEYECRVYPDNAPPHFPTETPHYE